MKKLIALAALILPLSVSAQSTNVIITVRVEEGTTRTNDLTFSLSPMHVIGFHAGYEQNISVNGTNAPTFRGFVRQNVRDYLEPVKTLGQAYQINAAKIDKIQQSITANWENASAADRKLLTDWLAKYPPAP